MDALLNHGKAITYTKTPNFLSKFTDLCPYASVPKPTFSQLLKISVSECFQAQHFATCEKCSSLNVLEQYFSVAVRDEFQRSGRRRRLFHIPKSLMRLSKTRWPFWIKFAGIRAQRVPDTRLLPGVIFVTWPDPIQFWKSSGSGKPKIWYYPIFGYTRHFD